MPDPIVLQGKLLQDPKRPPELGWVVVEPPQTQGVGRITTVGYGDLPHDAMPPTLGGRDTLITPAFTDAHYHVPQVDLVGCDGLTLLDWLDTVVFPAEAWWARAGGIQNARTSARRLTRAGTAGVAAYLTSHTAASREVVDYFATRTPIRFHMGRSAMDRNAPDALTHEDQTRVRATPTASPILPQPPDNPRHRVSANPRFAISCTPELLAEIGWALNKLEQDGTPAFMQTHLSEMQPELDLVRTLFPDAPNYASVYDNAGLLSPRALLAHCVHLSDDEWALLAKRDAVAVHCPTANTFLNSGLFDLDAAQRHNVRVALGSDIGGGTDTAMPRVAKAMIDTAKVRQLTTHPRARIPTPHEAWSIITQGNAHMLGWHDAGTIEQGAQADLLALRVPETWFDEHLVGRLIYNWDNTLITHRVFNGQHTDPDTLG